MAELNRTGYMSSVIEFFFGESVELRYEQTIEPHQHGWCGDGSPCGWMVATHAMNDMW